VRVAGAEPSAISATLAALLRPDPGKRIHDARKAAQVPVDDEPWVERIGWPSRERADGKA